MAEWGRRDAPMRARPMQMWEGVSPGRVHGNIAVLIRAGPGADVARGCEQIEAYRLSRGTRGVLKEHSPKGYSRGTLRVLNGYSQGTQGALERGTQGGVSRGTEGALPPGLLSGYSPGAHRAPVSRRRRRRARSARARSAARCAHAPRRPVAAIHDDLLQRRSIMRVPPGYRNSRCCATRMARPRKKDFRQK